MIDAGGLALSKQWTGQRLANNGGNCIFIAWPGPGPILATDQTGGQIWKPIKIIDQ